MKWAAKQKVFFLNLQNCKYEDRWYIYYDIINCVLYLIEFMDRIPASVVAYIVKVAEEEGHGVEPGHTRARHTCSIQNLYT